MKVNFYYYYYYFALFHKKTEGGLFNLVFCGIRPQLWITYLILYPIRLNTKYGIGIYYHIHFISGIPNKVIGFTYLTRNYNELFFNFFYNESINYSS